MARYHLQSQESADFKEIVAFLSKNYLVSHICLQDWQGSIKILPSFWIWFSTNAPYNAVKLAIERTAPTARLIWVKTCPFRD
jgi:hypothetical protein